jgi:hypothetical protein
VSADALGIHRMVVPYVRRRPVPPAAMVGFALLVAALSLVAGDALRADPQGWLRWGREIVLGDGAFSTLGYPSWKPLPVLVTGPLALTGDLAPVLLVVLLRAAGILALLLIFTIAHRRGGVVAGLLAAAALALTAEWWPALAGGAIEPALVALLCAAVLCHDAGHHRRTLVLLCLLALARQEAVALVVLYGVLLTPRGRGWPLAAACAALAIVAVWLVGDWLGSGDPLHGGALARAAPDAVAARSTGAPGLVAVDTFLDLLAAPLWAAAAIGVVVTLRRGDRTLALLLIAALVWTTIDIAMAVAGYPVPARFLFPAAAALCLAAGLGGAAGVHWLRGAPLAPVPDAARTR